MIERKSRKQRKPIKENQITYPKSQTRSVRHPSLSTSRAPAPKHPEKKMQENTNTSRISWPRSNFFLFIFYFSRKRLNNKGVNMQRWNKYSVGIHFVNIQSVQMKIRHRKMQTHNFLSSCSCVFLSPLCNVFLWKTSASYDKHFPSLRAWSPFIYLLATETLECP